MIDTLHSQLLTLSRNGKYSFDRFRDDWGRTNSNKYNTMKADFSREMRKLAMDCPVKSASGAFYVYNGKIYEMVPQMVVEQAYQLLVTDLYVSPMIYNKSVMKEAFLQTIVAYNILRPTFDIVAFKNGVVDFGAGTKIKEPKVMPFSKDYHVTSSVTHTLEISVLCAQNPLGELQHVLWGGILEQPFISLLSFKESCLQEHTAQSTVRKKRQRVLYELQRILVRRIGDDALAFIRHSVCQQKILNSSKAPVNLVR